ncbi:MAG: hypothetical protein J5958_01420 [Clostridia bacterium]|nr:hypothetical protein [Clostridia bacterium]
MKIKIIGDSYALISGNDPGENGFLPLRLLGEEPVSTLTVNGRAFPVSDGVCRVPVTAFLTGSNRIALRLSDGRAVSSEGIRLTGGVFSAAGAELGDVIAACDKRFAAVDARQRELAARVKALKEDFGILP